MSALPSGQPRSHDRRDEQRILARAQELYGERRWAEAKELFGKLLEEFPGNTVTADRYASCCAHLNQWEEAKAAWQATIEAHGLQESRLNGLATALAYLNEATAAHELLLSSRASVAFDALTWVLLTVAELAVGDNDRAIEHARHIAEGPPPRVRRAVVEFARHAGRLARLGRGQATLAAVRALLPLLSEPPPQLLMTAGTIALKIADWNGCIEFARAARQLQPMSVEPVSLLADALSRLGEVDQARAVLNAFRGQLDVSDRAVLGRLESIANRINTVSSWTARLRAPLVQDDFASVCLHAVALMSLRRLPEALDVLMSAMERSGRHAWLLTLAARCEAEAGNAEHALELSEQAVAAPGSGLYARVFHARLLAEMPRTQEAIEATLALSIYHGRSAVDRLFSRLGLPSPVPSKSPEQVDAPPACGQDWLHGGDSGDLIYALAAMQAGGGGRLFLTPYPRTREAMDAAKSAFLAPLLEAQPYVSQVAIWRGEVIDRDFLVFRLGDSDKPDLLTLHWQSVLGSVPPDLERPWLSIPEARRHGRPVFARSPRYRNPRWDALWAQLKATTPEAIFVGTPEGYAEYGHGEHIYAQDALELATVIAGASVFVGNQSLPYAIAEGLKVGRMLEVSDLAPNCNFPGALRLSF